MNQLFTWLTAGKGCTAYDIVVHPTFLVRMQNSDVMLGFFLTIVMQGLEAKYDLTLDRKWKNPQK